MGQNFIVSKKSETQSISLSKDLKIEIATYIEQGKEEFPSDSRFKSISSFITYLMKKAMNIFEEGKELKDFENFVDEKIVSFYEPYSFKALKPLYEMITEPNRYQSYDFEEIIAFLLNVREIATKSLRDRNFNRYKAFLKRFELYFAKNKIASSLSFEPLTSKESEYMGIRISALSNYINISYESAKIFAAEFAILGLRVVAFNYSPEENYFRIDSLPTPLLFEDRLLKDQRKQLYEENISFIINSNNVLNDKDYYLWMRLAVDKSLYLKFHNPSARERWFDLITSDIKEYPSKNKYVLNLLKIFEKLHIGSARKPRPLGRGGSAVR
ncbi:MAG: hypothetical protein BAJALOKI1v1_210036 [Promethearchaeota archaeon]|nr:MAG: hypothetical protein BAJALOKI1v1_210036 [Candidatus Lokiarchaeota archaeon]